MEITSLHKYISLNKLANGSTEVLFSGQPCIYTSKLNVIAVGESLGEYHWKINPIFAKLVYGANVFEDIPQCSESFETDEEAVAAGLVKLHEMGAFSTEIDLPEDSYAATMSEIQDEVKTTALQNANGIMDAQKQYNESMEKLFGKVILEAMESPSKEYKHVEPYDKWVSDVQAKHSDKNIKFKGRVEKGVHTTSAEVAGKDRSYGVWDHDKEEGHVFEEEIQEKTLTPAEKTKMEEIVKALKKDKKFVSKYGEDSAYAIATAKAKEVA